MRSVLRLLKLSIVPLLLVGVVVGLLFWPEPPRDDSGGAADYTCSMHPQVRLPKGQKCPLCGMDLVPVSQLSALQAQLEERAGVQTEAVRYRELFKEVRTVGRLDYNERQVALITARIANEAGREVMAVPGSPLDPRAQGCNLLIREGATLVQSVDDILEAIRPIDARAVRAPASSYGAEPPQDASDAERRAVTTLLGPVPVAVDELIRQSTLPPALVQTVLLELELAGLLERHAGGRVSLI